MDLRQPQQGGPHGQRAHRGHRPADEPSRRHREEGRRHRRAGAPPGRRPGRGRLPGRAGRPRRARRNRPGRPVRPDRRLADRAGLRGAPRGRGGPRRLRAAGAVGQHVRVQHHLHRGRRRRVPGAAGAAEERALAGPVPDHHGPAAPRPRRHRALHGQRPAGPGPALVLAVHPRLHRDLLRCRVLRRRGGHDPVPVQGLVREQAGGRPEPRLLRHLGPGAAARLRHPGQVRLPGERGRLPAVDVHDHRGRDLGRRRLGPLLELGPQGDVVVHHLGRLRLLPARAGHGRLEGPQGRLPGDDRLRLLAVQLLRREHLRHRQALLRGRVSQGSPTLES
ncbi:Cytochrome c-type biogenesis protein CcsA/ResC [Streptomyces misionensis JCM 4497]